jgi:hypothetical protein
MSTELEQRFYAAFDPEVPSPGLLSEIYVDLDDARGGHITQSIARAIMRASPTRPVCKLLSGHKGSGKTVELMHLKQELEKSGEFTVIHWLADETIDLMAVDFPDLLLGLVAAVAKDLWERFGIKLKPGYFATLPARLKDFLSSEISIEEGQFETGFASITASLKQSPSVRAKVREALDPESQTLLDAANTILAEARSALKEKGLPDKIVLLVDDLDKGGWERHPTAGITTGQFLFVNRHAQLSGLSSHVLYTLPLELAYGGIGGTLQNRYGQIPVIPMVEVRKCPPDASRHQLGVDRMREVIMRRLATVGIMNPDDAFVDETMDQLIHASGGEPRQLMHLISDALLHGALPIQKAAADRAITLATRTLRRTMTNEDWEIVRNVATDGRLPIDVHTEARVRSLLFNRQVLQYCNGEEWFAPSPLLGPPPVVHVQR